MGREIRRVPLDWQHPTRKEGETLSYQRVGDPIPLHDDDIEGAFEKWHAGLAAWLKGEHPDQIKDGEKEWFDYPVTYAGYVQWAGRSPDPESYRERRWTVDEATAFQIYETVTEGTPISPVLADEAAVIAWLIGEGYSERAATEFVQHGSAPSGAIIGGVFAKDIDVYNIMPPAPHAAREDG